MSQSTEEQERAAFLAKLGMSAPAVNPPPPPGYAPGQPHAMAAPPPPPPPPPPPSAPAPAYDASKVHFAPDGTVYDLIGPAPGTWVQRQPGAPSPFSTPVAPPPPPPPPAAAEPAKKRGRPPKAQAVEAPPPPPVPTQHIAPPVAAVQPPPPPPPPAPHVGTGQNGGSEPPAQLTARERETAYVLLYAKQRELNAIELWLGLSPSEW